ncbi:DUF1015 family protein [Portibacter lacus]|uniref:DUF1015 domain-containing protein n=1 Tax=Portibacter lacus TaxID=1099794 RepID=A0AA37WF57_9BACT|nr:DUF1015 family protein [Portibacter lacus]GLR18493.1 hypothetical protein GCM10007940_31090 [Portibacter lacus]
MRVQSFKASYPNKSLLISPSTFFDTMGVNFAKHQTSGLFEDVDEDAMFVYQIKVKDIKYRGIINNTEIQDLIDGNILLHEDTIPEKEQDMVEDTLERKAMIKPVLLFHKKNKKLNKIINAYIDNEPKFYSFDLDDASTHTLWKISDEDQLEQIRNIFLFGVAKAFVADGHHRCKASKMLYKNKPSQFRDLDFSRMLTAYFSEDQVEIYDHVKMIDILDTIKPEVFIAELSEYASVRLITKFSYPDKKREFAVLLNGEIYKGKWRKKVLKDFEVSPDALDAYIMNQIVFKTIFKIADVRSDKRISFFSGNEKVKSILKRSTDNPNSICILQNSLTLSDVKKFSSKKKNLPPKSTWFEPRIKSGIIAQKY